MTLLVVKNGCWTEALGDILPAFQAAFATRTERNHYGTLVASTWDSYARIQEFADQRSSYSARASP